MVGKLTLDQSVSELLSWEDTLPSATITHDL